MISVNQLRYNKIEIDDCPSIYTRQGRKGSQQMIVGYDDDDDPVTVPFDFENNLLTFECQTPTKDDLKNLPMFVLTSDELWDPSSVQSTLHSMNTFHPTLPGNDINPSQRLAHNIVSS